MLKDTSVRKLSVVLIFALMIGAVPAFAASSGAGQYIDDATITAKVKAALLSDSQMKSTHVSVKTNQGTVQLSGTVESQEQVAEATQAANQVIGVKSVTNLLSVKGTQQQTE